METESLSADASNTAQSSAAETLSGDGHAENGVLWAENGRSVESVSADEGASFRVGDRITHPKCGPGEVVEVLPGSPVVLLKYIPDDDPDRRCYPIYRREASGICRLDGST